MTREDEKRVAALEAKVETLTKQLHGMRKLFFGERKNGGRQQHSEMNNPMLKDWLANLPRDTRGVSDDFRRGQEWSGRVHRDK